MKHIDAIVGFSANPELVAIYDSSRPDHKLPLDGLNLDLSGTSGDIVVALSQLGRSACLIGLTGVNHSLPDELLDACLKKFGLDFMSLRVLNHTSVAFLRGDKAPGSDNRVCGKRGQVIPELVNNETRRLAEFFSQNAEVLPVVSGLKDYELPFFEEATKNRQAIMNPNMFFCDKKELFLKSLNKSVALFLNQREFEATGFSDLRQAHLDGYGPSLVVVTNGKKGGQYSLQGQTGTYEPIIFEGVHYKAGTGDWFLAGFLAEMFDREIDIRQISRKETESCLKYGALVSGKKALYPGAANGPKKTDLV